MLNTDLPGPLGDDTLDFTLLFLPSSYLVFIGIYFSVPDV
jgi:hypothetical protein